MNDRRPLIIGVAALVLVGLVRATALFSPGAPSGIDGGNWLAFGSFDRPGMAYPPVVPALFSGLVGVVGAVTATAISGALSAIASALGVLVILTWAGHARTGVLAALAIATSGAIGEVAAWGGYPQPIATAFALIALTAAAHWLGSAGRTSFVVFAAAFAGVVATSHLVGILALAAVLILIGLATILGQANLRRAVLVGMVALLPFLVLLPTYATLAALSEQPVIEPTDSAERVLGAVWPVYFAIVIAVPTALVLAHRRPAVAAELRPGDQAVLRAATAGGVTWFLAYLVTREPRLLYDLLVLSCLGAAAAMPVVLSIVRSPGRRQLIAAVAFGAIVAIAGSGMAAFPEQVAFYRVLSPDRFDSIQWLAKNAREPRSIVVADVAGVPIGWWVEGLVGEETVYASDLRWVRFPSERDRARQANTFLYRSVFPTRSSAEAAEQAGIAYVFLPSAGAFGIDPGHPPAGWTVAFTRGDSIVLAPAPAVIESSGG